MTTVIVLFLSGMLILFKVCLWYVIDEHNVMLLYCRREHASNASKLQRHACGMKQQNPMGRRCDLIVLDKGSQLELSSSKFAGKLDQDKVIYDQGKNLRYTPLPKVSDTLWSANKITPRSVHSNWNISPYIELNFKRFFFSSRQKLQLSKTIESNFSFTHYIL